MSPEGSGGDKTERATPRKRRQAREKGQIFKSHDLVLALSLIILVATLQLFGGWMSDQIKLIMVGAFTNVPSELDPVSAQGALGNAILAFLTLMAPILLVALLGAFVFNALQTGLMFSPKAAAPKFSRINPLEGFKRIFSRRTLVELLKSILKLAVLVVLAWGEYEAQIEKSPGMMNMDIVASIGAMVDTLFAVAYKLAIALAIMAPFDFLYQWWQYEKDLMMTKQEVKDEYKLTEGDPQIKGKIKQRQRQMSAMRMMEAVGGADVVITNPTHYAIALSYQEGVHAAPVVVAKGKDFLAQKIKERARERGVEMVENKPLAQQLYFYCEIGDEVPEELYQAVAEILAYIFKMRERQRGVR